MLHLLQNPVPVLPTTKVSNADDVLYVSLIARTCISTTCNNTTRSVQVLYNLVPGRREQPLGKSTTTNDSNPSTRVTLPSFWKTTKKVPSLPLTTFRSLTNSLTVTQLMDHSERIYSRQRHAFRLNLEIGLILKHTETGEYHILALSTTNLSSSNPSIYPGAKI